ncbi:MAG: DUF1080 domain-containing protein [Saprospiraceae bacterium]|nr:DUF1080 domain-containing protein [Saprospiraceae bacterium]
MLRFSLTYLLMVVYFTTVNSQTNPTYYSIFNGDDFSGWIVPENNIWWKAENGILSVTSGPELKGNILWTEKQYQDFIIKCDFKMGKGIVDSGIFLRSDNEQIQIGISGSLKRDMTCSPYIPGKGYPVEATGVQELLKPTDWNILKVQAKGNEYKAWLNGKEVMTYTSDTAIESGPIGLQLHGGKEMSIEYRNLEVAEL